MSNEFVNSDVRIATITTPMTVTNHPNGKLPSLFSPPLVNKWKKAAETGFFGE